MTKVTHEKAAIKAVQKKIERLKASLARYAEELEAAEAYLAFLMKRSGQ